VHIVVELEGVLRGAHSFTPIPEGVLMTGALSAYNQITFITEMNVKDAERWLNENKIVDFDHIIDISVQIMDEDLKSRQLKLALAKGGVGLFITSNPTLWAFSFEQGIPSVMFGVPSYLRPEFRPDAPKKMRAWNEIEDAVRRQNEARTKDARIIRTETLRFE
jgi:hypothetical protein